MKKTAGAIALDLLKSKERETGYVNVQEVANESLEAREKNLIYCVQHARKKVDCATELPNFIDAHYGHEHCKDQPALEHDFYVSINLKKENYLQGVRSQYVTTVDCPTPFYDQTVFKFNSKLERLEFLWTVPDQETCEIFRENALRIVPEEQELLKFVLAFYNGDLMKLCKYLNGEIATAGVALAN